MQYIGAICIRLQCAALPIHAWGAVLNMLCAGLGRAVGALLLSTARQGTCFFPLIFPMTSLLGTYGVVSVQGAADCLTLLLAVPIHVKMMHLIQSVGAAEVTET